MRIQPRKSAQMSCFKFQSTGTHVRVKCIFNLRVVQQITVKETYIAHSSCPFILANMAKEEVARLVVGDDSGMCKAGSPGDDDSHADAFLVDTGMCKAGFVGDDAVGNGSGMCKRQKCLLLDELDIILEFARVVEGLDRRPC